MCGGLVAAIRNAVLHWSAARRGPRPPRRRYPAPRTPDPDSRGRASRKTREAVRDLPIAPALERALAGHLARVAPGPVDLVFPGGYQNYGHVRRAWRAVCTAAKVAGATPHDARHTFAVLQRLLGHATPIMTMRYMKHTPEAYLDQDAAAIAWHLAGAMMRKRRREWRRPGGNQTGMKPKRSATIFAPGGVEAAAAAWRACLSYSWRRCFLHRGGVAQLVEQGTFNP